MHQVKNRVFLEFFTHWSNGCSNCCLISFCFSRIFIFKVQDLIYYAYAPLPFCSLDTLLPEGINGTPCVLTKIHPGSRVSREQNGKGAHRQTASSRRNVILSVFVTFCAAHNRSNKCNSYGLAPIAYISFLSILKKCLHYKSGPYLTQSVIWSLFTLVSA